MSWFDSWVQYFPQLFDGLQVSLLLTAVALLFGLPLGLLLAISVQSPRRVVRAIALVIVEVGRGAPALVILQFAYFGLPSAGIVLPAFLAASLALVWSTGAYSSEVMRSGLNAVPGGELEASDALGMSRRDRMRFIILPQGLRIAVPALIGIAILMFQSTALAYSIGVRELLSQAYSIGSSNFDYLTVLALAGVMYAAVSVPATWITVGLEKRIARG
ncbi:amino acid ABC transporter permease [Microbacterium allomyrinae]|uniref:Amino acid ABC transporter permease n=1 Tax=Microbacterium allomyrinae TaxID=2830666 RepID=A0A9X1LVN8_9MICO|nr:amino acid ABC transporter permease [Microbacterium allomyrinae]MCC2032641.1 amino acid ABC transporter permease [Microbacterium allomyrinae]